METKRELEDRVSDCVAKHSEAILTKLYKNIEYNPYTNLRSGGYRMTEQGIKEVAKLILEQTSAEIPHKKIDLPVLFPDDDKIKLVRNLNKNVADRILTASGVKP